MSLFESLLDREPAARIVPGEEFRLVPYHQDQDRAMAPGEAHASYVREIVPAVAQQGMAGRRIRASAGRAEPSRAGNVSSNHATVALAAAVSWPVAAVTAPTGAASAWMGDK